MSDEVYAKDSGQDFKPHPDGQYVAVCVDVVNLGDRVNDFEGHISIRPSVALVFATEERREDGELLTVSSEFTVSMHSQSKLRPFLESWRGKTFTPEECQRGVPLHKLTGVPCLLTIEHRTSKKGRVYAAPMNPAKLPNAMKDAIPDVSGYKRPSYWQERKDAYAAEVARVKGPEMDHNGDGPMYDESGEEIPF